MKRFALWSVVRGPWSVAILAAVIGLAAVPPSSGSDSKQRTTDNGQRTNQDDVQDFIFLTQSRPVLVRLHVTLDGKPYRQVWNEFIDELYKHLDTDKDGSLDWDEAGNVPAPQTVFASGRGIIGGAVTPTNTIDRDKDKKVSRDELAVYYRDNGGASFQTRQGGLNTYLDGGMIRAGTGNADALNKAILAALDADKDGKLSRDELAKAEKTLLKKDANDNEVVTSGEILGKAPGGQMGQFTIITDINSAMPLPAESPFVLVTAGKTDRALARRIQAQYGPKNQKGAKLTREQLGLDEKTFKELDEDEDGQLDVEELARFARRTPDVELTINLGKGGAEKVDIHPAKGRPLTASARKEKNGGVVLDVGNTRFELRVGSGGDGGGIRVAFTSDDFYKNQFTAADQDNNGYLDRNESRRNGLFRRSFDLMDADKDGMLYLKEVIASINRGKELRDKAVASCVSLSVADQGKGLFDLFDKDADGRLSVRELRNFPKILADLDKDKDGKMAEAEIPRRYLLSALRGPSGGNGNAFRAIAISRGGAPAPTVPERKEGPVWFRKMDRNRDGDVSRREFLGDEKLFKKIDADGDRLIDPTEAEKADKAAREKR